MLLRDASETAAAGARLAAAAVSQLPAGRALRVYLTGDLGAGKTTFVRGFLRELGVRGHVRSPSYTLVEMYPVNAVTAVHVDLYRVSEGTGADALGLRDYDRAGHIWLIEWPERGAGLPPPDIRVELGHCEGGRRLAVTAAGTKIEAH